jgi:hypothetical protein
MLSATIDSPASLNQALSIVDDHIAQLDKELSQAHARRRAFLTCLNSMNPLLRLPAEILQQILGILVCDGHTSAWDDLESSMKFWRALVQSSTRWTQVMLVCSHLRRFAVASPLLWTRIHINCRNDHWLLLCTERAGSAPKVLSIDETFCRYRVGYETTLFSQTLMDSAMDLRIRLADEEYHPWKYYPPNPLSGVAANRPSPETLPASLTFKDRAGFISNRLKKPMDHLKCLQLAFLETRPFHLSSDFLGGRTSLLTQLALSEVEFDIDLPVLPALLDLNLRNVSACSLRRLIVFLSSTPTIERLALHNLRLQPAVELTSMKSAHLPRLQVLVVWCVHEILRKLLPLLPPPSESGVVGHTRLRDSDTVECEHETWRQIAQEARRLISAPVGMYAGSDDIYMDNIAWRVLAEDTFVLAGGPDREASLRALSPTYDFACRPRRIHIRNTDVGALFRRLFSLFRNCMMVDAVVIENCTGDVAPLRRWLSKRPRRYPVTSLEFQACSDYVARYGSISQLGQELVDAGLVRIVLEDGVCVAAAPPEEVDSDATSTISRAESTTYELSDDE